MLAFACLDHGMPVAPDNAAIVVKFARNSRLFKPDFNIAGEFSGGFLLFNLGTNRLDTQREQSALVAPEAFPRAFTITCTKISEYLIRLKDTLLC